MKHAHFYSGCYFCLGLKDPMNQYKEKWQYEWQIQSRFSAAKISNISFHFSRILRTVVWLAVYIS